MTHQLKGGYTTTDQRCDLILLPREEKVTDNLKYPISELLTDNMIPKSCMLPIGDNLMPIFQGNEGWCVGAGIGNECRSQPLVISQVDRDYAHDKIYWLAQELDPWEGGSYPGASPVYEGTSVNAGVEAYYRLGFCKEYRWQFGFDDILRALPYFGPMVCGTRWYESMYHVGLDAFIHVDPDSGRVGSHCWLLSGYNLEGEYFICQNSWQGWGYGLSTFKISFTDMRRLMSGLWGGEGCFPVNRKNPFQGEEVKMNEKVLTFAPNNPKYKTGVQLYNLGDEDITVKVDFWIHGSKLISTLLNVLSKDEYLFMIDYFVPELTEESKENYAIYFSSEGQYNVCAYHVHQATGGLFPFPVIEVPTDGDSIVAWGEI